MCAFLYVGVRVGFRFSSDKWVDCMRITYGSMTWGAFVIVLFFIQGVLTLI